MMSPESKPEAPSQPQSAHQAQSDSHAQSSLANANFTLREQKYQEACRGCVDNFKKILRRYAGGSGLRPGGFTNPSPAVVKPSNSADVEMRVLHSTLLDVYQKNPEALLAAFQKLNGKLIEALRPLILKGDELADVSLLTAEQVQAVRTKENSKAILQNKPLMLASVLEVLAEPKSKLHIREGFADKSFLLQLGREADLSKKIGKTELQRMVFAKLKEKLEADAELLGRIKEAGNYIATVRPDGYHISHPVFQGAENLSWVGSCDAESEASRDGFKDRYLIRRGDSDELRSEKRDFKGKVFKLWMEILQETQDFIDKTPRVGSFSSTDIVGLSDTHTALLTGEMTKFSHNLIRSIWLQDPKKVPYVPEFCRFMSMKNPELVDGGALRYEQGAATVTLNPDASRGALSMNTSRRFATTVGLMLKLIEKVGASTEQNSEAESSD